MIYKKILPIITVAMLSTSIFVGCGNKTEQTSAKSNEKVELTIHYGTNESGAFDSEWPVFKKAAELTNVTLKGTLPSTTTEWDQAYSLMIASGDMPDIVLTDNTNFFEQGAEGAYEPLDDLIENHAPNLKKFLNDNPDVKEMATGPDGKIWYVPFVQDGAAAEGWFVRKDWLDNLGLEQPKNIDELYTVLKAFKEKDPNGNGKADEIPYFDRAGAGALVDLYSLWGAYPGLHAVDGKVKYGPIEPAYKDAMENVSKWYAEGLIDPEVFTRGTKSRDILLGDNVGGMTHDFFGSTGNYNNTLVDKIPDFLFKPMTPPENVDGKIVEPTCRAKARSFGWGISASNENKEETIKYFDFWFTEEGRRLMNFGIEGDTYTMVDGKPVFTDKVLKADKPAVDILRTMGAQTSIGFQQDYEYEKQWTNPIALEGINEYIDNGYIEEQFPAVKFTDEEQKELEKINVKINTYLAESTQQWILGSKAIDFDGFVAEMKKLGVDKLVEINQAAYDRYMANMK